MMDDDIRDYIVEYFTWIEIARKEEN